MLRDIPEVIIGGFVMVFTVIILMFYYSTSYQQDKAIQLMNETVRTSTIANVDHASRVTEGQLYISKSEFENKVIDTLSTSGNKYFNDDTIYSFDYLEDSDGSIKSIRLKSEMNGAEFQSTVIVDISE